MSVQSVCPVCLGRIDAVYEESAGGVDLVKSCPAHGTFRAAVWRGEPAWASWRRPKTPSFPRHPLTEARRGCPYDCGLCPEHGQHTCTGQIEVTSRCDLRCPVCYASAGVESADPAQEEIARLLDTLRRVSGPCNVQFSGGEPTLRDDLPDIIRLARQRGFPFIQVNSNGLRLAREPAFAKALAEAGLDSVYLQCDGADDAVFRTLRGRPLLAEKLAAIRHCADAGLGVVLVATVAGDVNLAGLGDLLRLALSLNERSCLRGLHVQPMAFFGRYPQALADAPRVTLPDVMAALDGVCGVQITDFHPPGCEHALCSFSAVYRRDGAGLAPLDGVFACCDGERPDVPSAAEGARASKAFTARHWSAPAATAPNALGDDFDRFLARAAVDKRFTISGMAFQDAMTLDLDRVRGCCIHTVSPEGLLVPFCLYNLTSLGGASLYRVARNGHG